MSAKDRGPIAKTVDMAAAGPPQVRVLAEADASAFRELRLRALREDPVPFLTSYEEDASRSLDDFAARLRASSPGTEVLGALRDGKLVGTVGYYRHTAKKARHRVSLWGLFVPGEERRRGIGGALVRQAIDRIHAVPEVEQVELTVVTREQAARALYASIGFQVQGIIRHSMKLEKEYYDEAHLVLFLGDRTDDPRVALPAGLPAPKEDGAASHLKGMMLPDVVLPSSGGGGVRLASLEGRTVLFVYPRIAGPIEPHSPSWMAIPGAPGSAAEACAFRDQAHAIQEAGAAILGLSGQSRSEQREATKSLHLPFPLLSDHTLYLARELRLPTFEHDHDTYLRRITLVVDDGKITHVFHPVFPPDNHAEEVLAWLKANKR
jgi:peroxiredoxin/RimJ/RimL family protein N-acetyltransferase